MRRLLSLWPAISLSLIVSACVTPPDVPNCVPLGSNQWPEFVSMVKEACPFDLKCREKMGAWFKYMDNLRVSDHGYCTNTLSDVEFIVDNELNPWPEEDEKLKRRKTWSEVEATAVRVPVTSWVAIKAYIIAQCKKSNDCSKDITTWERKLSQIDRMLGE